MWREGNKIKINAMNHVPDNVEYNGINFPKIYFKMFLSSHELDLYSYLPTLYFLKKPVIPILFSKGCTYNCINCGGSKFANKIISNRTCIAKKNPKIVAQEILNISQGFNFPIRIIGDWRICGRRYCDKIFQYLGNYQITNPVTFEFFTPAPEHYIKKLNKNFKRISIELSPESGNQKVRMFQGRQFTNKGILDMVKKLKIFNEYILILWFQVGNALDSEETLKETIKFSEDVIKLAPNESHPFISPLAPYIDPGSLAFEQSESYGYNITRPNLFSQIEGFNQPIWKYYLNYETKLMNLDDIIRLSYKYVKKLNEIKLKYKIMSQEAYRESIKLLNFLENLTLRVDELWLKEGRENVNLFLKKLRFDKTGLKIKSNLTPILFPELKLLDLFKSGIKYSGYTIKNRFKNLI